MKEEDVRIRFAPNWAHPAGTRVWIGDRELRGVKTVQIEHTAGDVRLLTISLYANLEITTDVLPDDIQWPISDSVKTAAQESDHYMHKPPTHEPHPLSSSRAQS